MTAGKGGSEKAPLDQRPVYRSGKKFMGMCGLHAKQANQPQCPLRKRRPKRKRSFVGAPAPEEDGRICIMCHGQAAVFSSDIASDVAPSVPVCGGACEREYHRVCREYDDLRTACTTA